MIVDSHVHVGTWKYPAVEEYLPAMHTVGVDHAVLVQFVGNSDNSYLARCVAKDPRRFAAVAMVEPETPGAPEHIGRLAATGRFVGVRLWASSRSPGPDRWAVWRAVAEHGLAASVRGPLSDIVDADFTELLDELPQLRVRLEHVGFTQFPEAARDRSDFDRFLGLAKRPQVATMWAGFYANSAAPHPYPDADLYLRETVAAFGASRVMWSGDWNQPDPAPTHYTDALEHVLQRPYLTDDDRSWILGRAARRFFDWPADA